MKTLEEIVKLPDSPAPCPWCDTDPTYYESSNSIFCNDCRNACVDWGGPKEDCIAAWNSHLYRDVGYLLEWLEDRGIQFELCNRHPAIEGRKFCL